MKTACLTSRFLVAALAIASLSGTPAHAQATGPVQYALEAGMEQDEQIVRISGNYQANVRLTRTLMDEPQVVVDGALGMGNATLERELEGPPRLKITGNVDFNGAAVRRALSMLKVNWIPLKKLGSKARRRSR